MADAGELKAVISAETSDFIAKMNDIASKVQATADDSAARFDKMQASIDETGQKLAEASQEAGNFGHSLTELGEMAGLVVGLEQAVELLKEFVSDSIEAASQVQFLDAALTSLVGSTEAANEILETAAAVSRNTTASFLDLANAAQQMAAFGIGADAIKVAMEGIADWSEISGKSVGGLTNALENVYLTGNVTTRTLKTLGLSLDDLAAVMGVSADKVISTIKAMGAESDTTMEIMALAMKEKGEKSAVSLAATHEVVVNRLKTAWHEFAAFLGDEFLPGLDKVTSGLTYMLAGAAAAVTFMGNLAHPVQAATDAMNEYAKILGVTGDTSKKAGDNQKSMADQIKEAVAAALASADATDKATTKFKEYGPAVALITKAVDDFDQQQLKLNANFVAATQIYTHAIESGQGISEAYKDMQKAGAALGLTQQQVNDALGQTQVAAGQLPVALGSVHNAIGLIVSDEEALKQKEKELEDAFSNVGNNIADPVAAALDKIRQHSVDLQNQFDIQLQVYARLVDSGTTNSAQLKAAWDELKKTADELGLSIQGLTADVQAANGEMGNLPVVTVNAEAGIHGLIGTLDTAKNHGVDMAKQITNAIGRDLSKAISDMILQTGNIGDAFKKLGQDVLDVILNQIIKQGIDALLAKLATLGGMWGQIFGPTASAASSGASGAASAASSGIAAAGSAASSGVSAGLSAGLSGAIPIVGAIGAVGTMVSSIIGNFQMAHQTDILRSIELNTRLTATFIGGLGSGGLQDWAQIIAVNTTPLLDINTWIHDSWVNLLGDTDSMKNDIHKMAGAGTAVNVTVNISGASNPQQTAQDVVAALKSISPVFSP